MGWVYLAIASFFEICFATSLKASDGFTKLWPTLIFGVSVIGGMYFLSRAIQTLPLGTAYAIWTGLGAVGIVTVGILFYGESMDGPRLFFIGLLIFAMAGLKYVS